MRLTLQIIRINQRIIIPGLIVVLLFAISTTAEYSGQELKCPDGFMKWQRSCYKFSNYKASWLEAQAYCQVMRANLISIEYWQENRFIVGYIRKNKRANKFNRGFWIGGNDFAKEGEWRWVQTGEPIRYWNWYHGQPDNMKGQEHCLELEKKYGYRWNDQPCHIDNHFICEIPTEEIFF
ncbi:perlucin-like [Tubulanus polymorphus]|uniref:perlucin-like n=1 Tax=Tubulanus polymorphus TaxID=672921 RepID=UPI003DA3FF6F